MNSERWQRIENIFQAALDLPDDERAAFVRLECGGDVELRREVEKLVARGDGEDSFLESPVWTDSRILASTVKREIAESLDKQIARAPRSIIGERIGVYRIIEELGRGGMGVVYAAERADGEFRQKVAVKLIKRGMDTDFIVKRFRRERQILANLNHPNIARLLDGGTTADDSPYFVMEFVEGLPLLEYCRKCKLDLRQKLELFLQICRAVEYAHRKKIVHRDIKPSNILVTKENAPKLLDFGIAKLLDADAAGESAARTATAMRLMTPEYASPEQIKGEIVAFASDQYSLGVLLYELITGARPYKFASRAPREIARVICEETPSAPSLDADSNANLDNAVLKALQKNPADRYASISEFASEIERFLRGEASAGEPFARAASDSENSPPRVSLAAAEQKSIAVLPFKSLNALPGNSGDADFLRVGLADALVTRLSNVRQFVVRPTSSVLRFAAPNVDSFAAGKELNAKFVLDGSIVKIENRIRVSVQLLDVARRSIVWAERFDEDFTDVLALEDSISTRVAASLVPQLSTGEAKKLTRRATDNAAAYESYLRGRAAWNTFTADGLRQAIEFYQQAIRLDPNFSLALAGVADSLMWAGIFGALSPAQSYKRAKQTATRAITLDSNLAEAHAALGFARLCGNFEWRESENDVRRAIEIAPNYAVAHNWLAIHLLTAGRFDEGIRHARRAVEIDPLTYQNYRTLSWGFYFSRRFEEAIAEVDRAIEKFPQTGTALANRSWLLRIVGRTDEALKSSEKAVQTAGDNLFVKLGHAQALAAAGKSRAADEIVAQVQTQAQTRYVSQYQIALVYCYAKQREKALAALERAFADCEGWLVWLGVEPALDFLRGEPRFQKLLEQINHPLALVDSKSLASNSVAQSDAQKQAASLPDQINARSTIAKKRGLSAVLKSVVSGARFLKSNNRK